MFHYKLKVVILVPLAIFLGAVIYFWYQELPRNYVEVYFLDVGQGDAILIRGLQGEDILIDGGKDAKVLKELAEVLPVYDRHLDLAIVTHPDLDHYGGMLPVLNSYQISGFLDNGVGKDNVTYEKLQAEVENKKIKRFIGRAGMVVKLGQEVKLEIIYPSSEVDKLKDSNDGSLVMVLKYGDQKVLLTGDASDSVESRLQKEYGNNLRAQILKLGHHGSKTSSSESFLKIVDPEVAVISAGLNNRYGHPHKEVTDRLKKLNIPYQNTADDGRVCFKIYNSFVLNCGG